MYVNFVFVEDEYPESTVHVQDVAMTLGAMIAIIVGVITFIIIFLIVLICCCCKRRTNAGHVYRQPVNHQVIVTHQTTSPPPATYSTNVGYSAGFRSVPPSQPNMAMAPPHQGTAPPIGYPPAGYQHGGYPPANQQPAGGYQPAGYTSAPYPPQDVKLQPSGMYASPLLTTGC